MVYEVAIAEFVVQWTCTKWYILINVYTLDTSCMLQQTLCSKRSKHAYLLLWYFAILVCNEANASFSLAISVFCKHVECWWSLAWMKKPHILSCLLSCSQVSVAIKISIFLFVSSSLMRFSLLFISLALTVDILMFLTISSQFSSVVAICQILCVFFFFYFVLFFFLFCSFCSWFSCLILVHELF